MGNQTSNALAQQRCAMKTQGLETSARVWEMKKAGLSFRQIAIRMDMSPAGVHEAYKRVVKMLKEELAESADDWLQLQIGRLEEVASFQYKVMKGMDVRPKELKDRDPVDENGVPRPSAAIYPTIEERLMAARDIVKSSESLRKMLGLDKPEKHEVDARFLVGNIDLTELSGSELAKEVEGLGAMLKTRNSGEVEQLVSSNGNNGDAADDQRDSIPDVQQQQEA